MMFSPKRVTSLKFSNFILSTIASLLLIGAFWLALIGLTKIGFPFPHVAEKFLDLGLFSISTFSFIIFLTIIPFQITSGKLAPDFFSRVLRNPWSHFGIYLLMNCCIICFLAFSIYQVNQKDYYLNQLFMALIASIITSILFLRFWVLRYLYHPYSVYKNLPTLMQEEPIEEVWTEIFECTYKAIKDGRLNEVKSFVNLLVLLYNNSPKKERDGFLQEDLKDLHKLTQDLLPASRYMEAKWPFLRSSVRQQETKSLAEGLADSFSS